MGEPIVYNYLEGKTHLPWWLSLGRVLVAIFWLNLLLVLWAFLMGWIPEHAPWGVAVIMAVLPPVGSLAVALAEQKGQK